VGIAFGVDGSRLKTVGKMLDDPTVLIRVCARLQHADTQFLALDRFQGVLRILGKIASRHEDSQEDYGKSSATHGTRSLPGLSG
jgi:hypothetical protein